jgi:hypothetical protein
MSGSRQSGPLGYGSRPDSLEDGTLHRGLSPIPGPVGAHAGSPHGHWSPSPLSRSARVHRARSIESALPVLREGSRGKEVEKLQRQLNLRLTPSPGIAEDGIFGPLTLHCVVIYQQGVSTVQDGVVGKKTWYYLLKGDVVRIAQRPNAGVGPDTRGTPSIPRKSSGLVTPASHAGGGATAGLALAATSSPSPPKAAHVRVGELTLHEKFIKVVHRLDWARIRSRLGKDWRDLKATSLHEFEEAVVVGLVLMALLAMLTGGIAVVLSIVSIGMSAAMRLASAIQITILAESEGELDEAADELAEVIIQVGVLAFLAAISGAARLLKNRTSSLAEGKSSAPPEETAPPLKKKAQAKPETEKTSTQAEEKPLKKKADPNAIKPLRNNPEALKGRDPSDVEAELDKSLVQDGGWTKSTAADGNGVRYTDGKGGLVIVNKGYPEGLAGGGGDSIHAGPYVKIQPGNLRVPLAGNPTLPEN